MSHLFKVNDTRHGKVFLPEAFVAHEEDDVQQTGRQQKNNTYRGDQIQEQHRSDTCKEKGKRDALAKEFGIPANQIAEQQQALNYARGKKEIEGQMECQNKEIEEVQKALAEAISLKEQKQRLAEIKQQRGKLNMQPKDTQQNAAATSAGINLQVPSSHSGTHPPHRGPGLPHQHTQPSSRPSPSGSHLGYHRQFSLDENCTSSTPRRPPAHQPSHDYEYVQDMTSSEIQGQGSSREEETYDHLGPRGFHGSQSGTQPPHLVSTQQTSQPPVPVQQASHHPAVPRSAPPQPSPRPSPQPIPSQQWDPHQNQFFPDQAPYAFTSSSQQGEVQLGELGVGSTVQISDPPRYGVIKWLGELPNIQGVVAGVELVSLQRYAVTNQTLVYIQYYLFSGGVYGWMC